MKNPFYNITKKDFVKGAFFNLLLTFLALVMIKLTPESIGTEWSWWIITAPIWIPSVIIAIVFFFVWLLCFISEYAIQDDEPYENN